MMVHDTHGIYSKPLTKYDMLGQFFSLLFFIFSLTCYHVFFFFSLSSILLITLLCYMLYVNFVIVCYLTPIYYQFYGSISVTTFVKVDYFFPRWPWPPTLSSSAFSKQLRFHRFSLISFCSRFKVVFLYCNYYLFALCRNLLFYGLVKIFADHEFTCCVLELALAPSWHF